MSTRPPSQIDGAHVLYWTATKLSSSSRPESADQPAYYAIARYAGSDKVYRFSCNSKWETINDFDFDSIDDAKRFRSEGQQDEDFDWQASSPEHR